MNIKDNFIKSIHNYNKVKIQFYSKEDKMVIERLCAPMDFGPSRKTKDKADRFHFWDYNSDKKNHTLNISQDSIYKLEILDEKFSPNEFITWDVKKSPWFIDRDWAEYS